MKKLPLPLLLLGGAVLLFTMKSKSKISLRLKETNGPFETLIAKEETGKDVYYWEFVVNKGVRPKSLPKQKARVDPEDWNAAKPA